MKILTKHNEISFVKNAIRIFGYITILYSLPIAIALLILAEIVGVAEEIEDD